MSIETRWTLIKGPRDPQRHMYDELTGGPEKMLPGGKILI